MAVDRNTKILARRRRGDMVVEENEECGGKRERETQRQTKKNAGGPSRGSGSSPF